MSFKQVINGENSKLGLSQVENCCWPKMLVDTRAHIKHGFIEEGLSNDNAINLARIAVVALSIHIGWNMMYLPRGERLQKALWNAETYKLFDVNNTTELAIQFKLSRQTIIEILKNQRELTKASWC